ncbi:hypothetical protein BJX99DRAFT_222015 [Aspergillus californicus]
MMAWWKTGPETPPFTDKSFHVSQDRHEHIFPEFNSGYIDSQDGKVDSCPNNTNAFLPHTLCTYEGPWPYYSGLVRRADEETIRRSPNITQYVTQGRRMAGPPVEIAT